MAISTVCIMLRVALALGLLMSVASPAYAHTVYPGERPADAQVAEEVALALTFWAARGVTGCSAGIDVKFVNDLTDTDGLSPDGRGGHCWVRLSWPYLAEYRSSAVNDLRKRYSAAVYECMLVLHEVRHALPGGTVGGVDGRGHDAAGIMAPRGWGPPPAECAAYAASKSPLPGRATRKRSRRTRQPHVRVATGRLR